jgi:mono/diheme cytochrome c family protein
MRLIRLIAFISVLVTAAVIAGMVFFFGGFYDITADKGANAVVDWSLRAVREASLARHVQAPPPPAWFTSPTAVEAGAHEFAAKGCADCHGAPGVKPGEFTDGMEPRPPRHLDRTGQHDAPASLFFVIKHGIRMTAMPAFGGHASDDEIWRLAAFLRGLHAVTPAQYKQWSTAGERPPAASPVQEVPGPAPAPAGEAPGQ